MKIHRFSVIFTLLFSVFSYARSFSHDPFINDFVSKNWTAADGLPGNSITDLIQTNDGYLYFGSYDGLVRFDGVDFLTINKNSNPDFSFISARTLFEDSQHNFWIGANDEGITLRKADGTVKCFNIEDGLPNSSIRAIVEDKNGCIWIGTSSGIACYKDDLIFSPEDSENLPNNNHFLVQSMYCDTAGRVWINSADGNGTFIYAENKFTKFTRIKKINNPNITYITQDSKGDFWFGISPHYAIKKEGEIETLYDIGFGEQAGTLVTCIFQDSHQNVWISTDCGITILHGQKITYYDQKDGLCDEKISKIIEDREGNIWISTDRGGVQKLSQTKFKTIPINTTINAICSDKYRDVFWLAGDNGLYCYKNGEFITNEITSICKNIRLRHVGLTKDGSLLISAYDKLGQLKIDLNGNVKAWKKETGELSGNRVRVALEAKNGDLYIGTTNGLTRIKHDTQETVIYTKESGITNDYIMCLYEDDQENIWCGTDGGGIFILKDGEIIRTINHEDGLAGNVVFKITSLKEGEIWVCTGTGVTRIKNNSFANFNTSKGMGTDSVFQMILDYTQKVWCTSNKGVFSVKLQELEDVADGKAEKVHAKYYGSSDGIISGGVTSTSVSTRDELGRIWFTLIDGIAMYDPVKYASNTKPPIIHIQEVNVDSSSIVPKGETIYISPQGKRLRIKYTGLSFISSEQVQFKYKLEGFDKDYSDWTFDRSVSYTNLKPGSYKFTVLAQNSDEVQSEPTESLLVIKKPAIWQQFWFWLLIIAFVGGIIYLYVRYKINILNHEKEKLKILYSEITQAFTSTIDAKDKYTRGHSNRVALYSKMIAQRMGKTEEEQEQIYMTAILHDIGKIGIPDSIINKPGKLTDEEYKIIKQHPTIGSEILSGITTIKEIYKGARWHHERFDGSGYPDGLKGYDIPEEARIIGVADAYDAMTSNRSYRNLLPQDVVRNEILKGKGVQFDPEIADIMISIINEDTEFKLHE